ncbi:peroxiredoxin-like family protein [Prosthecomicrobium sp. N25]|uniref:peroxiredoxin-like family protein n=1 Tax=Prosthecomicrobium sp. N25 TaxID=3129254 RepID=UPI0030778BEC
MTRTPSLADALAEICALDAPLWRRLALYVERQTEAGSPFVSAGQELVDRLRAGEVGEAAPEVGDPMPDFLLPDRSGRLVSLGDLNRTGPVVVSFNRGHWCPFCRIELTALAEAHRDLAALGARVVSIMPDRQAFAGRLPAAVTGRLSVLTDVDCAYALSLGLGMWLGEGLKGLMLGQGLDLAAVHGSDGWVVPVPATFVVGPDGRVLARRVEADFRMRMELSEIVAALAAGRSA